MILRYLPLCCHVTLMKTPCFYCIAVLFLYCYPNLALSQPNIEWSRTYGGSKVEFPLSCKPTADGGYILAASSESSDGDVQSINRGELDFWLIKLDAKGTIEWQNTYGRSGDDMATSIALTSDKGYIVAGSSSAEGVENNDIMVVKVDSNGKEQWVKTFGGSAKEGAGFVEQIEDGGYIVAGYSKSSDGDLRSNRGNEDLWLFKLNENGEIVWQQTYGGTEYDQAMSLVSTHDGYLIAASSLSQNGDRTTYKGSCDVWLLKVNKNGELLWEKSFGGDGWDFVTKIKKTIDNAYIVLANSSSGNGDITEPKGDFDVWMVKVDTVGNLIWQKSVGARSSETGWSVDVLDDGGFLVGASVKDGDSAYMGRKGSYDWWVVKLTSDGNTEWQKLLGGSDDDRMAYVARRKEGGYIAVGGAASTDGDVQGNKGASDVWVVFLEGEGASIARETLFAEPMEDEVLIVPNPTQSSIEVYIPNADFDNATYRIVNSLGQVVSEGSLAEHETEQVISVANLSDGLYSLFIEYDNNISTEKFAIVR